MLSHPYNVIIISAAGSQFETAPLEFSDFIISDRSDDHPDFPHYYPEGRSPGSLEVMKELKMKGQSGFSLLEFGFYFNHNAFEVSLQEDLTLILASFSKMVASFNKTC